MSKSRFWSRAMSGVVFAAATALSMAACMSNTGTGNDGCADNKLACGAFCCPDDTHYACVNAECMLTSCDAGLQLCAHGCIPVTANCCDQTTGVYCQSGEVCCGKGCIPIGTSCCGNGSYCPVGRVCCNNNTQCC